MKNYKKFILIFFPFLLFSQTELFEKKNFIVENDTLMFLVKMVKERYYMYGLMLQLDIFHQQKNGQKEKIKTGNHIGKIKTQSWFIS
jgi:hypothetical protein